MSYCTIDDLIQRFGEDEIRHLTDLDNSGKLNPDTVELAILDATATIDGYLKDLLTPEQIAERPVFKIKACDIARYYLHTNNIPEVVEKRYQAAIDFLTTMQDRMGNRPGGVGVSSEAPPRLFTMDTMKGV